MIRALRVAALSVSLSACAVSHVRDGDVSASDASVSDADAPTGDASPPDAAPRIDAGPGPRCGPNRCRSGEICCNERCGICAFADECGEISCPGAP